MRIIIETVPHSDQPYNTVGDWRRDVNGDLRINVSRELGERECLLIAVHELIEAVLCEYRGVTAELVDEFDKAFEENRQPGDKSEPGDDRAAPYHREHFFATNVERLLSEELAVNWQDYEVKINQL